MGGKDRAVSEGEKEPFEDTLQRVLISKTGLTVFTASSSILLAVLEELYVPHELAGVMAQNGKQKAGNMPEICRKYGINILYHSHHIFTIRTDRKEV